MTASDAILIPLQCEFYAMEGLSQILNTIRLVQKGLNPLLRIEGILLTMFDARNRLSKEVEDEVRAHFPNEVFETVIPRNVRLSEAPSHGTPVIYYDIASRGAAAYLQLARELIRRGGAMLKKQVLAGGWQLCCRWSRPLVRSSIFSVPLSRSVLTAISPASGSILKSWRSLPLPSRKKGLFSRWW